MFSVANEEEAIQQLAQINDSNNVSGSVVNTPLSTHTPHTAGHTPHGAPKSATNKLVGSTFFGPDFNIDTFRGIYKSINDSFMCPTLCKF